MRRLHKQRRPRRVSRARTSRTAGREQEHFIAFVLIGGAVLASIYFMLQAIAGYNRVIIDFARSSAAQIPNPPSITYFKTNNPDNSVPLGTSIELSWSTKANDRGTPYSCWLNSAPFKEHWYPSGETTIGPLMQSVVVEISCVNTIGGPKAWASRKITVAKGDDGGSNTYLDGGE